MTDSDNDKPIEFDEDLLEEEEEEEFSFVQDNTSAADKAKSVRVRRAIEEHMERKHRSDDYFDMNDIEE